MNLLELNHVEKSFENLSVLKSVGFKGYFTECERGRDRVHHRTVRLG